MHFFFVPSQLTSSNAKIALLNEKISKQPQFSALSNKTFIHSLLFGHPELSYLPTVVIFPALSQILKNGGHFKSVVWKCLLAFFSGASHCYIICLWFLFFLLSLPFILCLLTCLDKRPQPGLGLSLIVLNKFVALHGIQLLMWKEVPCFEIVHDIPDASEKEDRSRNQTHAPKNIQDPRTHLVCTEHYGRALLWTWSVMNAVL